MSYSRRTFLSAGGIGLLAFTVAGCERKLTPAQARVEGATYRTLTAAEVAAIDTLGESMLPGAAEAGLAHYIDHQLSAPLLDSMLMIKYLGVNPPFLPFYRTGLGAYVMAASDRFGDVPQKLQAEQRQALLDQLTSGKLPAWQGPPLGLFCFVLRTDAVDVMYGTQEGFEKLGVPYMPHIAPRTRWGA
jgi:hypothetical protein